MLENIGEATRWLDEALRPDPGRQERLLAAVSTLSSKPQLAILLRSLLANRHSMAAAAALSYAHPLGFDKLVLVTSEDLDHQVRLHVWWPGRTDTIEDVHNHRFPFASTVLDGVLEMQAFEPAAEGIPVQKYVCTPGEEIGTTSFRYVGDAFLGRAFTSRMPVGTVYGTSARTLHRITVAHTGLTATLFLQGPVMQPRTAVFSEQAIRQRPTIVRPTMAPWLFGERVAAYLESLEASLAA